jgi:hypothetical protein
VRGREVRHRHLLERRKKPCRFSVGFGRLARRRDRRTPDELDGLAGARSPFEDARAAARRWIQAAAHRGRRRGPRAGLGGGDLQRLAALPPTHDEDARDLAVDRALDVDPGELGSVQRARCVDREPHPDLDAGVLRGDAHHVKQSVRAVEQRPALRLDPYDATRSDSMPPAAPQHAFAKGELPLVREHLAVGQLDRNAIELDAQRPRIDASDRSGRLGRVERRHRGEPVAVEDAADERPRVREGRAFFDGARAAQVAVSDGQPGFAASLDLGLDAREVDCPGVCRHRRRRDFGSARSRTFPSNGLWGRSAQAARGSSCPGTGSSPRGRDSRAAAGTGEPAPCAGA